MRTRLFPARRCMARRESGRLPDMDQRNRTKEKAVGAALMGVLLLGALFVPVLFEDPGGASLVIRTGVVLLGLVASFVGLAIERTRNFAIGSLIMLAVPLLALTVVFATVLITGDLMK